MSLCNLISTNLNAPSSPRRSGSTWNSYLDHVVLRVEICINKPLTKRKPLETELKNKGEEKVKGVKRDVYP